MSELLVTIRKSDDPEDTKRQFREQWDAFKPHWPEQHVELEDEWFTMDRLHCEQEVLADTGEVQVIRFSDFRWVRMTPEEIRASLEGRKAERERRRAA